MSSPERFLDAALAYCFLCEEIRLLSSEVLRLSGCEIAEEPSLSERGEVEHPGTPACFEAVVHHEDVGDGCGLTQPLQVPWWETTEEERAEFCEDCRRRVVLWTRRWELRKGLGGRKARLMRAYRARLAAS